MASNVHLMALNLAGCLVTIGEREKSRAITHTWLTQAANEGVFTKIINFSQMLKNHVEFLLYSIIACACIPRAFLYPSSQVEGTLGLYHSSTYCYGIPTGLT